MRVPSTISPAIVAKVYANVLMTSYFCSSREQEGFSTSESQSTSCVCRKNEKRRECKSDRRRNYLKTKLKELLSDFPATYDDVMIGNVESKPEPEVVAAALLMTENEDLAKSKPNSIFEKLFSDELPGQIVDIVSAAEEVEDVVVPVLSRGRKPATVMKMTNVDRVLQKARTTIIPNPNAFQESREFEDFTESRREFLDRNPQTNDVSTYVGDSTAENDEKILQDTIMEYVIQPELPSYANRVRLNGSVKPPWFPGYTFVSPTIVDCVTTISDAGEALFEGWRLCRPKHFHENSKILYECE